MSNFLYTHAAAEILKANIDFDAPDDFRVCLVMTNTTCDTEKDVDTCGDFTTPDWMDGTNYAVKELSGDTVTEDEANDRGEYDAGDITWSSLGAGTRNVQAAVLIKWVTDLNSSIPIAYIDSGGFPFTADGADVTIQWNAEGILQLSG